MSADDETLAERIARYREEWLWHEADDERREGHGHHMGQMLYRLPVDGQTRDMKASIESMIADLETLVATPAQPAVPVEAQRLIELVRALADDMETEPEFGTMPRLRMRTRDLWAKRLRAALAEYEGGKS